MPRTTSPKPVDAVVDDGPTLVDALREDADKLTEYPPGTPELEPYLQLRPRSRRSAFKRKFAELTEIEDRIKDLNRRIVDVAKDGAAPSTPQRAAVRMRLSADLDDLYQLMDEVLEIAAVDRAAFRGWSDNLDDDNDLARVFQLYINRSQPGEASSSAS